MHSFSIEIFQSNPNGSGEFSWQPTIEISNDGVNWYTIPDDQLTPPGPIEVGDTNKVHIDITTRTHYVRVHFHSEYEGTTNLTFQAVIVAGEA
jgi:hypothetical protein